MIKKITMLSLMFFASMISLNAQVNLTNASPNFTIDFSSSTPTTAGTNPGSQFSGAGFSSNPTTAGRLNSNAWQLTSVSNTLAFGSTSTTGVFASGAVNTAQTGGGLYAYTGAPGSASNPALMIQPSGSAFIPGTITLKIVNTGTTAINSFTIAYNLFIRNDQGRSSSFNFSYSTDNNTYTNVSALDYTSPTTLDALGWVSAGSKSTIINTLSIAPSSTLFIRWTTNDVAGSGSRDEIGLDDISVKSHFETVTKLSTSFCGYTATNNNEFIWADTLGLPSTTTNDRYRFKLVSGATTLTWTTNNQWPILQFALVPGVLNSTTYTTSVAWSSDNGTTFGSYGPTCLLTSPGVPTTSMLPAYCSYTPSSYNELMTAQDQVGTSFRFKLENAALNYTQTFTNTNKNVNLAQYTGLTAGTTYSISVSVFYNNAFGPYGNVCQVTTPAAPTTSMMPAYCNFTPTSYSQLMTAENQIGNAFKFKLENAALGYTQTFTNANKNVNLIQYTGLTPGTTYSISVSVFYNNAFGPYGNVCQVTTPSAPTTSVVSGNCNYTPSSYSQLMYVNVVSGAQAYEYKLENASLSYAQTFTNVNQNFNFAVFTGLSTNTTYTVSARVKYSNAWGPYGATCIVTTPSSSSMQINLDIPQSARDSKMSDDNISALNTLEAVVYPNPYKDIFVINLTSYNVQDEVSVNVYDATGKLIEHYNSLPGTGQLKELGLNYTAGIYNVVISQSGQTKNIKIIKQ